MCDKDKQYIVLTKDGGKTARVWAKRADWEGYLKLYTNQKLWVNKDPRGTSARNAERRMKKSLTGSIGIKQLKAHSITYSKFGNMI